MWGEEERSDRLPTFCPKLEDDSSTAKPRKSTAGANQTSSRDLRLVAVANNAPSVSISTGFVR
jgi:hypothetical protein